MTPRRRRLFSKGADLDVNAAATTSLSVATFDSTKAIACYVKNDGHGTCASLKLASDGTSLEAAKAGGTAHLLAVNAALGTTYMSVATFDATKAIACYVKDSAGGAFCNLITLAVDGGISKGTEQAVNAGAGTTFLTVATFDATKAIACYRLSLIHI